MLVVLLLEEFCDEEFEIWVLLPEDEDDREFEEFFDVLLDLRCFDDGGSVVCCCCRDDEEEDDAFDASVSFSGDDGASLECSA